MKLLHGSTLALVICWIVVLAWMGRYKRAAVIDVENKAPPMLPVRAPGSAKGGPPPEAGERGNAASKARGRSKGHAATAAMIGEQLARHRPQLARCFDEPARVRYAITVDARQALTMEAALGASYEQLLCIRRQFKGFRLPEAAGPGRYSIEQKY